MLLQSLVVYTVFISVLLFLSLPSSRRAKKRAGIPVVTSHNEPYPISLVMLFIVFSLVSGMRYDVGVDHLSYLSDYISGEVFRSEKTEFLFSLISRLFYAVHVHPVLYFAFFAFIQLFLFLKFFDEERYLYPFLVVFLFFTGIFSSWMNGIRQDVACCIWIFSLQFVLHRRPLLYVLSVIIAFGFHRSAFILLIIYPILRLSEGRFNRIPLQIAIYLAAILLHQFSDLYAGYLSDLVNWYGQRISSSAYDYTDYYSYDSMMSSTRDIYTGNTGAGMWFSRLIYLVIIFYSNKLKVFFGSTKCEYCYILFYIGIIAYTIVPSGSLALLRPFRYFRPFYLIMLSYLLFYFINCTKERFGKMYAAIITIAFVVLYYGQMLMSNSKAHFWYQFYFQHAEVMGLPLW